MRALSPCQKEKVAGIVARAIEARSRGDGRPFIVGHFITQRCMCKCKSCLWVDNACQDVPTDELKRFYREAREEGFVATAISGGEPFLRRDLGEILRFVKEELQMSILLFNTGWFLEKRMDEVVPHVDAMLVSLDSARPERHDEIRGLRGLFDRLTRGVQVVRQRYPEVSLQFNTCVQRGVVDEIDDLIELTEALDMRISFDVITEYRHGEGESRARETDMGLPLSELQRVCRGLLERKRAGAPIVNSELYFDYFVQGRRGYRCHLPKLVMFVDGQGNIENCLNLERPIANIRDMPLGAILELPEFKQLRVDAERCWSCNSPTMVDLSHVWENPQLVFQAGGIALA